MSGTSLALQLAGSLRDRLAARFGDRLTDVRVFGSQVRGGVHEESDVDVLVLIEGLTRSERSAALDVSAEVGIEAGVPVNALLMKPEEFERLRSVGARLALDIDREGVSP